MKRQKFYQITVDSKNREAEIIIYGDITSFATDLERCYGDDENIAEVSSRQIIKEINALDVDTINVYINSYGGEVAEALAIYSALKRHSASVHTYCDGFACSAATIIFCAGDVRTMGSIALMMIHNCMSYVGYANSSEMRKAAEDNDKINQSSIEAYKLVSNLSEEEIRQMMDDATWMTAEECLQYGFATDIAEQDEDDTGAQQSAMPLIREAILKGQLATIDMSPVLKSIEELKEHLMTIDMSSVLQQIAELKEQMATQPEEGNPETRNTMEKAKIFFGLMAKEEN